jgi:FkbM family methyltransferase
MFRKLKSYPHEILNVLSLLPIRALNCEWRSELIEKLFESSQYKLKIGSNTNLTFLASTPILAMRARTVLTKEPDTIRWLESFRPQEVLWDIGANVGVYSIYAAVVSNVRVLAFEPAADNYMALCRNLDLNGLTDKVIPYCIAFSSATRLGRLNSSYRKVGAALHQFGDAGARSRYWTNDGETNTQGMIGFSIDSFIRAFEPSFPTHLKVDVDGLEIDILKGACESIRDTRVRSIMIELPIDDQDARNCSLQLLFKAGFELKSQGEIQVSGGAKAANHLFLRGDR